MLDFARRWGYNIIMKRILSRTLYLLVFLLCCLLAIGLVSACTVYCVHAVEGEAHCDCPVCRIVTAIGGGFALSMVVFAVAVAVRRTARHPRATLRRRSPVLLAVKLNC